MSPVQVLRAGWGGSGPGDQRGLEEGPTKHRLPVPWQTGRQGSSIQWGKWQEGIRNIPAGLEQPGERV